MNGERYRNMNMNVLLKSLFGGAMSYFGDQNWQPNSSDSTPIVAVFHNVFVSAFFLCCLQCICIYFLAVHVIFLDIVISIQTSFTSGLNCLAYQTFFFIFSE